MMTHSRTREIARADWPHFLDSVSRHYQGREAKIEVLGPELGVHVIARGMPLMGITAEKGARGDLEIQVIAGDPNKGHVTHVIDAPEHVWVEQEMNGGDNALEIASSEGNAVIVELFEEQKKPVAFGQRLR